METITTRDLVHRSKEVRKRLAACATLRWTSHGKSVAVLSSGKNLPEKSKPDWISRARPQFQDHPVPACGPSYGIRHLRGTIECLNFSRSARESQRFDVGLRISDTVT
jgi:hypothetical protein